jgi:hypothetical protein
MLYGRHQGQRGRGTNPDRGSGFRSNNWHPALRPTTAAHILILMSMVRPTIILLANSLAIL